MSLNGWSRDGARVYGTVSTETTCTRCDEPISAGETVIWMPGINARGAAHPRCTFLTDPGRRRGPTIGRTAASSWSQHL
jgi:hypothetical protein